MNQYLTSLKICDIQKPMFKLKYVHQNTDKVFLIILVADSTQNLMQVYFRKTLMAKNNEFMQKCHTWNKSKNGRTRFLATKQLIFFF